MKIILDTNFLLLPAQFRVDIYELLKNDELFTLDFCIRELEILARSGKKENIFAKVALELVKTKNVKILKVEKGKTDSAIAKIAKTHNYAVATNDKNLIKSLKSYRIKIIRLKQKKFLVEE